MAAGIATGGQRLHTSSFEETLLALRGLAAYGQQHGSVEAMAGAAKAAEVFLARRMLFRRADGTRITAQFGCLHYPRYWHYDYLGGLEAMVEAGAIADDRCRLRSTSWSRSVFVTAGGPPSQRSTQPRPAAGSRWTASSGAIRARVD